MATNTNQSVGLAAMCATPKVVPIAWDADTSGVFSLLPVLSFVDEEVPLG